MKIKKPTSYKILYPVNRTSRRFLMAVNKIRKFFNENNALCIPCVENPFDILLSTKKMNYHNISVVEFKYKDENGKKENRHIIKFHGSLDKRKTLMADYLRSKVIPEHNAVLLPKSITNFYKSDQSKFYCSPRYKSLEQQSNVQLTLNFDEYDI